MNKTIASIVLTLIASQAFSDTSAPSEEDLEEFKIYMGNSMCSKMPEENPYRCLNSFRAELAEECILEKLESACDDFIRLSTNRVFKSLWIVSSAVEIDESGNYRYKK